MPKFGRKSDIYIRAIDLVLENYYEGHVFTMKSVNDFLNHPLVEFSANLFSEKSIDFRSDLLRKHLENMKNKTEKGWTILPK